MSLFEPLPALLLIPLVAYITLQMWQSGILLRYKHQYQPEPAVWPRISIWIAARNEEENIEACLRALQAMNYPAEAVQILVGNDQSTDRTGEIVRNLALEDPRIQLVEIEDRRDGLKAKARVMAQLDEHAQGEFYLITDADVCVAPTWAKALLRSFKPETGVVSGTTVVKGQDTNAALQGLDWCYFMGMLNTISYSGVPATAVGNNMAIRKEAYWQTGGYRSIQFSITEDYKLYSEVCQYGWKWDNIMQREVLATSTEIKGFIPLLHQRKRWLSGGRELPWYWWVLFGVFAAFYFALPVLLFVDFALALFVLFIKWSLQSWQIRRIHDLLGESKPRLGALLAYEPYLWSLTISTAIFFVLPIKTNWKSRRY
ncbi:MAG: hypothetical protein RL577_747 [Bacteroidota bacterium]|jgi:cellulose synthase/poly-beta-1,6-N-acetylglucosamine synthase-like glycosyltransferase